MNRSSGLTLLEVVVALGVLVVGALGAAGLQASSLRATRAAQDLQQITALASSQLEVWRAATLTHSTFQAYDCSTDSLACTVTVRPCAVSGSGVACDVGTVAQPKASAVQVTVASDERSFTLETLVAP